MDFKFRRESITANNDTAPVNGIGSNTPDGVKYLSGESGALQFGGEAIGGGGGGGVIVNVTMDDTGALVFDRVINDIIGIASSDEKVTLVFSNGISRMYLNCTTADANGALFSALAVTGDIVPGIFTISSVGVVVFQLSAGPNGGNCYVGQTALTMAQ